MDGPSFPDENQAALLANQLFDLLAAMDRLRSRVDLGEVHPNHLMSAGNVLDYVALRRRDIRPLQDELTQAGLSSLGRCEAHVRDNLLAIVRLLRKLAPNVVGPEPKSTGPTYQTGLELLKLRTEQLFGASPEKRSVHIMITMPSQAADDYGLVRQLVEHGMTCMRINCSHDSQAQWAAMISHLRRANQALERSCRVAMDLGGPKLRTCALPAGVRSIRLQRGARIMLVGEEFAASKPENAGEDLEVLPQIRCTLNAFFKDVQVGERILFDDGKIGGQVQDAGDSYMIVEITSARDKGEKLKGDKGINLPDSKLQLAALTAKDLRDLDFIIEHADMVAYSFVRHPQDVARLREELHRRGRPEMPILLKVETREAFERLPSLLLAAMRSPLVGVMIARGDLAVELGYERLAEVQEEILWICEAGHVPVVWATQVLEQLAKKGTPSRAEVTDAAMGVRAECVMLNKGPFIVEALKTLDDILMRMQAHQSKKRPTLRRLRLANDLAVEEAEGPSTPR